MSEDCNVCGDEIEPEGACEYSNVHGRICFPCIKAEYPHHIIGPEGSLDERKDVTVVLIDAGHLALHGPTGIAAVGKTDEEATILLRRIWRDVDTVESNERYGIIME